MAGGRLDDPEWLVRADPAEVLAALEGAADRPEVSAAAVYRASSSLHQYLGAGVRRQVLALDAARLGNAGFGARIAGVDVAGEPPSRWTVDWATGALFDPRIRLVIADPASPLACVATAVVDGRPVAVTGSATGTVRMWDLATGLPVGDPMTGHTDDVWAVTTAVLDGRPVAVSGAADGSVRRWDLAAERSTGILIAGVDGKGVVAVATGTVEGRPIAVAGNGKVIRAFDLATGEPMWHVVCAGSFPAQHALATAVVDGRPVVLTDGADGGVEGRMVVVTGSGDETVRIWDPATGLPVGEPLTGHTDCVTAVTTAVVDGRPVVFSGSFDGTVRMWSAATSTEMAPAVFFPEMVGAVAVAPGGQLLVGFDRELACLSPR
ncbi:outer membrane protein assembly factor BamB [Catenulispora sp. MAP5-51]|uniref:WD40 repeat domain-containing protein n=1 Tax=Catenulispora sp. MAP5-51 TaxID=3156298 RepID=UPI003518E372